MAYVMHHYHNLTNFLTQLSLFYVPSASCLGFILMLVTSGAKNHKNAHFWGPLNLNFLRTPNISLANSQLPSNKCWNTTDIITPLETN